MHTGRYFFLPFWINFLFVRSHLMDRAGLPEMNKVWTWLLWLIGNNDRWMRWKGLLICVSWILKCEEHFHDFFFLDLSRFYWIHLFLDYLTEYTFILNYWTEYTILKIRIISILNAFHQLFYRIHLSRILHSIKNLKLSKKNVKNAN